MTRKYRSTRGMKSSQRDRCTLHKKHLVEFKTWFIGEPGWQILPETGHTYEVFHVIQVSRSGDGPHSFIYRNDHNDHLTVQADLVPMMHKWLRWRKRQSKKK